MFGRIFDMKGSQGDRQRRNFRYGELKYSEQMRKMMLRYNGIYPFCQTMVFGAGDSGGSLVVCYK